MNVMPPTSIPTVTDAVSDTFTDTCTVPTRRPMLPTHAHLGRHTSDPAHAHTDSQRMIDRASRWMTQSGAQVMSEHSALNGGFVSWYEQDTQQYAYVYSEITGYMLTMLASLYTRNRDVRFLNSAIRAGDWVANTAHEPTGGFRCLFPLRPTRFDYKHDQIYTFDCGVILNGLANLYRVTHHPKYLSAATSVADWLVYEAQKTDKGLYPVFDIQSGRFHENDQEWSLCPGSYHTKVAIGLLNLHNLTRKPAYLRATLNLCDYALEFQESTGRFITFPAGGTNTHPHTYSAEGLWSVGKYLNREDYLQASANATAWLLDLQNEEGIVPRHYQHGEPLYNERVDVLSQALRMGAIHLSERRLSESYLPCLEKLAAVIARNQASSDDIRADGGFYFGRLSDGTTMPHVNVWVTMFAIQALTALDDYKHGWLAFKPFDMV